MIKAEEILEQYHKIHNGCYFPQDTINTMLEFAKEMCELQKLECSNKAEAEYTFIGNRDENSLIEVYIIKESILNCKNVCDE